MPQEAILEVETGSRVGGSAARRGLPLPRAGRSMTPREDTMGCYAASSVAPRPVKRFRSRPDNG